MSWVNGSSCPGEQTSSVPADTLTPGFYRASWPSDCEDRTLTQSRNSFWKPSFTCFYTFISQTGIPDIKRLIWLVTKTCDLSIGLISTSSSKQWNSALKLKYDFHSLMCHNTCHRGCMFVIVFINCEWIFNATIFTCTPSLYYGVLPQQTSRHHVIY